MKNNTHERKRTHQPDSKTQAQIVVGIKYLQESQKQQNRFDNWAANHLKAIETVIHI